MQIGGQCAGVTGPSQAGFLTGFREDSEDAYGEDPLVLTFKPFKPQQASLLPGGTPLW